MEAAGTKGQINYLISYFYMAAIAGLRGLRLLREGGAATVIFAGINPLTVQRCTLDRIQ